MRGMLVVSLLLFLTAGTAAQTVAITNGSFEQGLFGWTKTGRFQSNFTVPAAAGKAALAIGVAASDAGATGTVWQAVNLPATPKYRLVFMHSITTAETGSVARDRFFVDILNGQTGLKLATPLTLSNVDKTTGYVRRVVPLDAYAGKPIRIQFRSDSNFTLVTRFLTDAVALEKVEGPTSIKGKVRNLTTRAALASADVSFAGVRMKSAADGSYELKNVPCQSNRLRAEAANFVTLDEAYTPLCGIANEREILLKPQPAKITGTVRDIPTGLALAEIEVFRGTEKQKTATNGSFTFTDVGCGPTTLTVNARGYKPWRKDVTPACSGTTKVDVALEPNLTALFLTVRSTEGGAVPANVNLGALSGTPNNFGRLVLTSIPCTPARLTVSAPGYRTVERNYTPACDTTNMQLVELEPYGTTIRGRVMHHVSDEPLAATVTIDNTAVTTTDGEYAITTHCGRTVLTVTANGYRPAKVFFTPECGAENTLDFPMLPLSGGASICGTVSSTQPVAEIGIEGAKVTLGTSSTITERYGTFCLPSVPCTAATVSMTASKAGYRDSLKKDQPRNCGGLTTVDFLMVEQHIEGTVTDASTGTSKAPIAGAVLTFNGQTAVSGARGQYRFSKMCGKGLLTVNAPGYHGVTKEIDPNCTTSLKPTADVSLQPNATNVMVRLTEGLKGIDDLVVLWGSMPATPAGDGWYTFPNVLCQDAPLTVFSTTYATERIPLRATCGISSSQAHGLTRIRTLMRVAVRDGIHGGPLPGATVRWKDVSAMTTSDMWVYLQDALCGPGTLTLSKEGYTTKDVSLTVDCSQPLYEAGQITIGR